VHADGIRHKELAASKKLLRTFGLRIKLEVSWVINHHSIQAQGSAFSPPRFSRTRASHHGTEGKVSSEGKGRC
jgi:hypothetical protein